MTLGELQNIDRTNIWHPFTQQRDLAGLEPLVIERGKGLFLWDHTGKRYYDTIASWWTNVHGHSHPKIKRAISRQAGRLDHVNFSGFTHRPAAELVHLLQQWLPPSLDRFFFSDNGSTAVEVALKMAFQYFLNNGQSAKTGFVYLENGYHGDTLGAVSVGGIDQFHQPFRPLRFPAWRLPAPVPLRLTNGFTGNPVAQVAPEPGWLALERLLRQQQGQIAAIIVEPLIQCVGGMCPYPAEYLQRLAALAKEFEVLVIYDEVATGFGRTGTMFAMDQAGATPDFLCLSKGITGGVLPLAMTVTTNAIAERFVGDPHTKTFFHGHSYTANPISCAAAVASLRLFEAEHTLERLAEPMRVFHQELLDFATNDDMIGDVRYLGLIGAIDLARSRQSGEPANPAWRLGLRVYQESLRQGLVLRPLGDTIYWFLPLVTRAKDIRLIMQKSRTVLRRVKESLDD